MIVAWSSRRARPEGVWRSWGRGLWTGWEGAFAGVVWVIPEERGCSGIEGMTASLKRLL